MLTTGPGQALCRPHEAVRCPDQKSQSEHFQIVGLTDGPLRFRAYDALVALKEIEENVQPKEGWEVRRMWHREFVGKEHQLTDWRACTIL